MSLTGHGVGDQSTASIVPPPFGSGYSPARLPAFYPLRRASIVPPPFGSGYGQWIQSILPYAPASIVPPPFGSGYDGGNTPKPLMPSRASIVPPPFGSGYSATGGRITGGLSSLQSCRPLSGAVMCTPSTTPPSRSSGFNRAAPFRERLSDSIDAPAAQGYASIVPPPFGSGYRCRIRGAALSF